MNKQDEAGQLDEILTKLEHIDSGIKATVTALMLILREIAPETGQRVMDIANGGGTAQ